MRLVLPLLLVLATFCSAEALGDDIFPLKKGILRP